MHEHQTCVGVDFADVVECEQMVRRFQDPASRRQLGIEMLQKAPMEAIGIEKTAAFQPAVVGGYAVHGIEAQALKYMRGDVGALLGRIDRDRVQGVELWG